MTVTILVDMETGSSESVTEATASTYMQPRVVERYFEYAPPFDVATAVRGMLRSVPQKYLLGLSEVVLTNTAGLSRKLRRRVTKSRKRKVRIVEARGLYHHAWHGQPAWVEIYVNNVFSWATGWWRCFLKVPVLRDGELTGVLFHEIGHHIHATSSPAFREKEDVADIWKVRLLRIHNRSRPLWQKVLLLPLNLPFRIWKKSFQQWRLEKGIISHAEFDEIMKIKRKTAGSDE